MRQIGSLSGVEQAKLFGDLLLSRQIRNQIEGEADGSWSIWIHDDEQIPAAEALLTEFKANPNEASLKSASPRAAEIRRAEAQDLVDYRRRVRTSRSIFPRFGGYGVGILTYALIVICVVVAVYTKLGYDRDALRHLFISDPETAMPGQFLPEVRAGEIWRLFTPMFIHFGPIHLVFNMMWLYQLGCMIEARQSSTLLAGLVIVSELISSLAEHIIAGVITFGGMSGVVYALGGYVWIRGKYDRASGVFLDSQSVTILLVWLVVCYTGAIGPIANTAHLAGLIVGMLWGRISAYIAIRRG